MSAVHTQSVEEVLTTQRTTSAGLTPAEAAERLERHGPNELRETISRPAWHMLLAQFREPLILILVAAAILSLFLGDFVESIAILAIVFLFGVLGFIQEYRAEKAMAALRQLSSPVVRVRRHGELIEIPSRHLVPGDIVLLEAGNIVPADLRLVQGVDLSIMESTLTGESEAAHKQTAPLSAISLPLGDRLNLAYMGTMVVHGRGAGVVVATGMHTELGQIAGMIQGITSARTPLQRKLTQVGQHLSLAGLGAALALMAMGLLRGEVFTTTLLTAVSLLVAVIPEGLPAVITATLALGGRRMLKRHALIRKLPAVETLGAVTVICSDKTGTLTENRMTVAHLQTLHHEIALRGTATPPPAESQSETAPLLLLAALCNDAHLTFEKAGAPPTLIGEPTETALLLAAEHAGIPCQSLAQALPRITEFAFDSDRKRMTTLHTSSASNTLFPPCLHAPVMAAVKGSPDDLLALATQVLDHGRIAPLQDQNRQHFLAVNARLAEAGIRVLGVAFRCFATPPPPTATAADIETQLVFCGLAGLLDPPREEVRAAIARSHAAGIRTIMITGDHPLTAAAIAQRLRPVLDGTELRVLAGAELAALSDAELERHCEEVSVYARVSPHDKLRIISALQNRGHIVAMTGDGVNDSPALKRAEIGVAMGITGTDVAKESADMILLDDNFATIVAAIEEGRTIFDNLVRFIKFSFGGNLGKVLIMLGAPLAGISVLALRPLHLLWLNLLTDGLMGLGLGLEAPESDVMARPPRHPDAAILDRPAILHVSWMGLFICITSLLLAGVWIRLPHAAGEWQTVLFSAIGFAQIGQAWGLRSLTPRLFRFRANHTLVGLTLLTLVLQLAVVYIPALAHAFKLQPLSPTALGATAALGVLTFVVVHLQRWLHQLVATRKRGASQ